MRKARWFLSVALLAGCAYTPVLPAYIECACPRGRPPVHRAVLTVHTGKWGCSGHSLGPYREATTFAVQVPEDPPAYAHYQASQLTLRDEGQYPVAVIADTGGDVTIDRVKGELRVALQTEGGNFWANGTYPLTRP